MGYANVKHAAREDAEVVATRVNVVDNGLHSWADLSTRGDGVAERSRGQRLQGGREDRTPRRIQKPAAVVSLKFIGVGK